MKGHSISASFRALLFLWCGASLASPSDVASLEGRFSTFSFIPPAPMTDHKPIYSPTHIYTAGEMFEFGFRSPDGVVSSRLYYLPVKASGKQPAAGELLKERLDRLREHFPAARGSLVKVIDGPMNAKVPIFTFIAYGGETAEGSFRTPRGYEVAIDLFLDGSTGGHTKLMVRYIEGIMTTMKLVEKAPK